MNIITTKEAREKSDSYVSYSIKSAVEFVMKEIERHCNDGDHFVSFYSYTPINDFEAMKSNEFIEFMKKLGYKYAYDKTYRCGKCTEEITISW